MSAALEKALAQSEGKPSYRDILLMVTSQVTTTVRDQHPQFETVDSSELDRPFLGGAIPDSPRPLTLSRRPEGWTIDSGAVHGVPEPLRVGDTTDTTELATPTLSEGETWSDIEAAEVPDVEAIGAHGMAFERLDQLALEHLYGVRS